MKGSRHVAPSGGADEAFGLYVGDWIFSSVHYLKKGHLCGGVNKWNRSFVFTEWDKGLAAVDNMLILRHLKKICVSLLASR